MLFVAPTEPPMLKKLASKITLMPEKFGVDVYFVGNKGRKVGIQRKEIKDLLASVNDGRLVKEVIQMEALDYKILIVEGRVVFDEQGCLLANTFGQRWTRSQYDGLLWSVMDRGIWVCATGSLSDTCDTVQRMQRWFTKSSHNSLRNRPGIGKGIFGDGATSDEAAAWILQSIPGIGVKLADEIVKKFGLPLRLTVTREELMTIEGIGKTKAEMIVGMFEAVRENA